MKKAKLKMIKSRILKVKKVILNFSNLIILENRKLIMKNRLNLLRINKVKKDIKTAINLELLEVNHSKLLTKINKNLLVKTQF